MNVLYIKCLLLFILLSRQLQVCFVTIEQTLFVTYCFLFPLLLSVSLSVAHASSLQNENLNANESSRKMEESIILNPDAEKIMASGEKM